jgi:hypothetical protein
MAQTSGFKRLRSIFTRDMWFFLMALFFILSFVFTDFRDALLFCAFFSCVGILWMEHRENRVRKQCRKFRQEVMSAKYFEAQKQYDNALY